MDATSCGSGRTLVPLLRVLTIATTSSAPLLHLLLRSWIHLPHLISLLSLPLIVDAQHFNDPSTNWDLSGYYNPADFRFYNFTFCNNGSYLELLNEEPGLYGRIIYDDSEFVDSAHDSSLVPYAVFFKLYFVIAAEMVCMKDNGSSPAYYLSLVAQKVADVETFQNQNYIVIWTANPNKPVTQHACLQLNDSDITLTDYHDSMGSSSDVVWHISTGTSYLSLAINFEGNLVLFSNSSDPPYVPLWESFLNPTDTLMVLQVLENNSTLTVNSSSSSNYTMAIENGRLLLYAKIVGGEDSSSYGSPYWSLPSSSIVANGNITFACFCWDSVNQLRLYAGSDRSSDKSKEYRGMVSPEFCSTIPNNSDTTIRITGLHHNMTATYATLLRLEADGDLRGYTVDNTTDGSSSSWRTFYSLFNNTPCDLPLYCGFYGMCDPQRKDGIYCTCSYNGSENDPELGFNNASDPKSGCNLQNDGVQLWQEGQEESRCDTSVGFLTVTNVHYFSIDFTMTSQEVLGSADCKSQCEKNCSCAAAFWNESAGSCFLVLGRLGTIRKQGTMQAFIKYAKNSHHLWWKVVGPLMAAAILVVCIFLAYLRRRAAQQMSELEKQCLLLLSRLDCSNIERFTWKQMHEYTCSFSDLLGGGGFGRVFRGALPDRRAIAVKQLDEGGSQGQGDKEFIAEVSILSRIRHGHLVRLIGFCFEGTHRLLVYEYMENGSLDAKLFKRHATSMVREAYADQQDGKMNEKDKGWEPLSWKIRFQIAMGTAKGLAYLHEECEEKVIHMDLKPQNILLDSNFHAKISDFGMSKRTRREQSSVMTVMRGTPGYLAPEWLLDCAITEKCDVYSYGIVLLEMVSGRKVKDLRALKHKLSMRPLRESVMLDLLDESLRYGSDVEEKEAVRMVEVALYCVRMDPVKRPSMGNVALMLEGKAEVLQEVADVADGEDGALELELVGYRSAMHSFTSLGNGSNYMWWSWDANNSSSYKKKKYFDLSKLHDNREHEVTP